ncbi:MAG: hypothetical protein A2934_01580 [Candidatus Sungbacteria bacterium RIFCSPLOWO2_01_FULL_47_10]|uniref:Uncharacterized protein n=1 Tax=Candidatus Sungbacteria bacterium RIFCSPLOWO2_01_FULL_47_10 TaxID=1802276 RepID=A0A1G2L9W4_9BACT|nr:MAG: hypothetical protein A2934_01580 [Candidatus Sungbacteria bacterium RIFCSPLOWO2_01_FULL_47_10]
MGAAMADPAKDETGCRPNKKYVIFFDVNMPWRRLVPHFHTLKQRAKLVPLRGKSIFNSDETLHDMDDADLLNYVIRVLDMQYPSFVCFFCTLDLGISEYIGKNHPAHNRVIIETFRQRSRHEWGLLAEEIMKRFEDKAKEIERAMDT